MNNKPLRALGLASAILLVTPVWAGVAVAPTLDLTGNLGDLVTDSFVSGPSIVDTGLLPLSSLDLPLDLNQGDSITATVNLDGPFTVPASPNQLLILEFGFGSGPPLFADPGPSVVQGSLSFYLANVFLFTSFSSCSNCVAIIAGSFPGSAYSFDRIEVTLDVNNLTAPFTIGAANMALQYNLSQPAPIPEPGTWALWAGGLGVMSLWARRRRGKAAETASH